MKSIKFNFTVIVLLAASVLILSCASAGGSQTPVFRWNFDNADAGTAGWAPAPEEHWDFKGTINASRDTATMGKPMLRVDIDFSKDAESWWSEPKLKYTFDELFDLSGYSKLSFDMYFNPANSTTGSFKGKVMFFQDKIAVTDSELNLIMPTEEVGDYLKASVVFRFRSTRSVNIIHLGIVGAVTNYKGPIFIDNLRLE